MPWNPMLRIICTGRPPMRVGSPDAPMIATDFASNMRFRLALDIKSLA